MDSVFLLWYARAPDSAEELFIGAYGTEEEAKAAIERLEDKPGFVDTPDGFQICPYEIIATTGRKASFSLQTERSK
jgi:hypothetical protein